MLYLRERSLFHLVEDVEIPGPHLHWVGSTYEKDVGAGVAELCAQSFAPILLHEVLEALGCVGLAHGEDDEPVLLVTAGFLNVVCSPQIRQPFYPDTMLTLARPAVCPHVRLVLKKSGQTQKTMWLGPQCARW